MSATCAAAACSGPSSWSATAPARKCSTPRLKVHERVKLAAFRHGVAVYPMGGTMDGKRGDHVIIAPAYIAEPQHIDAIVERLGAAVDDVLARL